MTTPLTTIADVLIDFILSLLRDPSAMAEFDEDPEGALERNGLGNVCAADVQAVKPVVIEHPQVVVRPDPPVVQHISYVQQAAPNPPSVVREIQNVAQNFHIDNRSTIVDQSVNQNIWAQGDVTQVFDQEAIIASGDAANAAGKDVDASKTDTTIGDVAIGNTDTTVTIDDSYNDSSTTTTTDVDATVSGSLNDSSTNTAVDATVADSFNDTTTTTQTTDVAVSTGDSSEVSFEDASYDDGGTLDAEPPADVTFDEP